MTTPTREEVFDALWTKVAGLSVSGRTFRTKNRTVRQWDDVAPEEYDCLFMAKGPERIERLKGNDPKTFMTALLYIYVRTNARADDTADSPGKAMNAVLDALDLALAPDNFVENTCTLGGLVSHAWISGEIMTAEGTLGDVEVAIVPVEILVPALVNQ